MHGDADDALCMLFLLIVHAVETEPVQQTQEGGVEEVSEKPAAEPVSEQPEVKGHEQQPAKEEGETAAPSLPQRRKVRTTDPSEGVDLAMGMKGMEAVPPITVSQMFQETVRKFPSHPALRYKEEGEWKSITYNGYYELCIRAAKSFLKVRCMITQLSSFVKMTKCQTYGEVPAYVGACVQDCDHCK